ncbi:MAG: S8 family serine peptidase [Ignavibacteriaceae bacterium]|nr:S8 family serine peptidase [Ignavibacteriaceae bacterium]
MKLKFLLLAILLSSSSLFSQDSTQTFLSVTNTGVEEYHNLYPEYDGRGTIIFILDTGVDIGVDGLTKTSTGETKVIDVQDFTHQGDVKFYEADVDNEEGKMIFENDDENLSVIASSSLSYTPVNGDYFIGGFEESRLLNSDSGAADLNGDGDTEDTYHLVTFEVSEGTDNFWIVYFDTNGNGDISDDKSLRDYKVNQDAFTIENQSGLSALYMGLNVLPEEQIVSLHFDDGSHGTHVAGIAAGYSIGGIDFNGVAPGANVISLKLGNNLFAGGATVTESMKKAYLYADKISKEVEVPCVINMSFGIGSEIEGHAEMEAFLEELTEENPYLYICLGSGNEGPGISSPGLPSASYAVFSSGAILTQEVGRDNYGATLNKDIILYFSSRGGEVRKPDVCSPGACTSTVPNWESWDRFWGTSMAAPYSAGVMSLLLSAASKEYPGVKIPSQLLYKIVRESATNMEGYNHLDQGHGYINAVNGLNLLRKYIDQGEVNKFETYTIVSTAPNFPNGKSSNLYLRNGSFLQKEDTYSFKITRNNFQETDKFYRAYRLECDSDWLLPIQKKTYIRNDQPTYVSVKFDKDKMKEPGLYTARITGYRDDRTKFPEFEMIAVVVIPYKLCSEGDLNLNWESKAVEQGLVDRYFIELPAGQTGMKINLSAVKKKYARARYRLVDPDGKDVDLSPQINTVDAKREIENTYYDLTPGVYELIVEGYFLAKDTSHYNLSVQFYGINRLDNKAITTENNSIEVVNLFNKVDDYNMRGSLLGFEIEHKVTIEGSEKFRMPFVLRSGESLKKFKLEFTKEDYNKFTDLAFMIYDSEGLVIEKSALSYKTGTLSLYNISSEDSTEYIFEIVPGFAHESSSAEFTLTETTHFRNSYSIDAVNNRKSIITLYPSLPKNVDLFFEKPNEYFPKDAQPIGKILFKSTSSNETEYELPIKLKF